MRRHSIDPLHQLHLTLPDPNGAWPEAIWESLPEEVQHEVMMRLAQLLERWFTSRRSEG